MTKNLVYDWEIRKHKFQQENKRITQKQKHKIRIIWKEWLPDDYPNNWTIDEKMGYLKKKLPPRTWKKPIKSNWFQTII